VGRIHSSAGNLKEIGVFVTAGYHFLLFYHFLMVVCCDEKKTVNPTNTHTIENATVKFRTPDGWMDGWMD
jgi:hypothetical protein